MTAAETWLALWDAAQAQWVRLYGIGSPPDPDAPGFEELTRHAEAQARRLRDRPRRDPRRELGTDEALIASYVKLDDVVIDVGGDWGRLGLPLALRCREVINVEPGGELFEEFAAEAGISNVSHVKSDWLAAKGIQGDVVLCIDVLSWTRDIVPFIEKLVDAAHRRVIIQLGNWQVYEYPELFRAIRSEDLEPDPGYPQLLPVLGELGIQPDMHRVPVHWLPIVHPLVPTQEEGLDQLLQAFPGLSPEDRSRARELIRGDFDEYFEQTCEGFRRRYSQDPRAMLITWETG